MTSKTEGKAAGAGGDSFEFEDDFAFNLRRAAEERAKAEQAGCEIERHWRLEIAAIFATRAHGAARVH